MVLQPQPTPPPLDQGHLDGSSIVNAIALLSKKCIAQTVLLKPHSSVCAERGRWRTQLVKSAAHGVESRQMGDPHIHEREGRNVSVEVHTQAKAYRRAQPAFQYIILRKWCD